MLRLKSLVFYLALSLGIFSRTILAQDGPDEVISDLGTLAGNTHDLVLKAQGLKAGNCYGHKDITERVKSITTKLADNADQLKNPPADFPPFGPHPDVVLAFRGFSSEVLSLASTLLRKGGGAVITCSYVLIVEIPIGDRKGLQTALPEFKDALYDYMNAIAVFDDYQDEMDYLGDIIKQEVELMLDAYKL